jgi:hypothetical protein
LRRADVLKPPVEPPGRSCGSGRRRELHQHDGYGGFPGWTLPFRGPETIQCCGRRPARRCHRCRRRPDTGIARSRSSAAAVRSVFRTACRPHRCWARRSRRRRSGPAVSSIPLHRPCSAPSPLRTRRGEGRARGSARRRSPDGSATGVARGCRERLHRRAGQ